MLGGAVKLAIVVLSLHSCVYGIGPPQLEAVNAGLETAGKAYELATKVIGEQNAKLTNRHKETMKAPDKIMNGEKEQKKADKFALKAQKAGSEDILIQPGQGDSGFGTYEAPSLRIKETFNPAPQPKAEPPSGGGSMPFMYPQGLGPVLFNQCYGDHYSQTSPCFNEKQYFIQKGLCFNAIPASNFIGVGFDGRGYYSAESRKISLVSRTCRNHGSFLDMDLPDTMNAFPIFDTDVESNTFTSIESYMKSLRKKAGVSNSDSMFKAEADKFETGTTANVNAFFGAFSSHASLGHGKDSKKESGTSSTGKNQQENASQNRRQSRNLFAIMNVNIILFEISLDEVKPEDLSLSFLKDYTSLPVSYLTPGAEQKYQNFILRYGTHYIRSAKMGGQLKIVKRSKTTSSMSSEQFATVAESEFKSMFSSMSSSFWKRSAGVNFMGNGVQHDTNDQKSKSSKETNSKSTHQSSSKSNTQAKKSKFTNTIVEAIGGDPLIAHSITDFYTPAFREDFSEWLASIKADSVPIDFTLRGIDTLLNINTDSLFNNKMQADEGCLSDKVRKDKNGKSFFIAESTVNNGTMTIRKKILCPYKDIDDFRKQFSVRHVSLGNAISIYFADGPKPSTSYELKGGEPGCESETYERYAGKRSATLKMADLKKRRFRLIVQSPATIPGVTGKQAEWEMFFLHGSWYTVPPGSNSFKLYEGCQDPGGQKVCFNRLIMTYNEKYETFSIKADDFKKSQNLLGKLPFWLKEATVARALSLHPTIDKKLEGTTLAMPCNFKWYNAHQMDPDVKSSCIHFSAATKGDIFIIFAANPMNKKSWYYVQIFDGGVGFYMHSKLRRVVKGMSMGTLGAKNLYDRFFVCVTKIPGGGVDMQYGKSKFDSDTGTVLATYQFAKQVESYEKLRFYTFGAGSSNINFQEIAVVKKLPLKMECPADHIQVSGKCVHHCHAWCKGGCETANDRRTCADCVPTTFKIRNEEYSDAWQCLRKCPVGFSSQSGGSHSAKICFRPWCKQGAIPTIKRLEMSTEAFQKKSSAGELHSTKISTKCKSPAKERTDWVIMHFSPVKICNVQITALKKNHNASDIEVFVRINGEWKNCGTSGDMSNKNKANIRCESKGTSDAVKFQRKVDAKHKTCLEVESLQVFKASVKDLDKRCAQWAKKGQCGKYVLYKMNYCGKSCGSALDDQENDASCPDLAKKGKCVANPGEMFRKCPRSCLSTLYDDNILCVKMAYNGMCRSSPKYMHSHCSKSCVAAQGDSNKRCSEWMRSGKCATDPKKMFVNCPKSCLPSTDMNPSCEEWAKNDGCSINQKFMNTHCYQKCTSIIADLNSDCAELEKKGYCTKKQEFMRKRCAKTCFQIAGDDHKDCATWAKSAVCETLPDYMFNHCYRSCEPLKKKFDFLSYGGHRYLFAKEALSFNDAKNSCKRRHMALVRIDGAAELAFLKKITKPLGASQVWIGLSDLASEGSFKWTDGCRATYTNWYPGEPNNQGNEDCTTMYRSSTGAEGWNDAKCSTKFRYICEKYKSSCGKK